MSGMLWFGLLLQAVSVGVLAVVFRRDLFRQAGTYFVLSAFAYHGVTEIVQRLQGEPSRYRSYTTTAAIDRWTVVAGAALLAFALLYVAAVRFARRPAPRPSDLDVTRVLSVLDWRPLAVLCVPLLAVAGSAAFSDAQLGNTGFSAAAGIAAQFVKVSLILATVGFVARHPRRLLPALVVELGVTALLMSRYDVVTTAVATFVLLALLGRTPRRRQVITALAACAVFAAAITAVREHVGRDQFRAASLTERAGLLVSATVDTISGRPGQIPGEQQPLGERLDGNSFPSAVMAAEARGRSTVGLVTLRNDVLLAVPSVVNPAKLSTSIENRSEKAYLNDHFGVLIIGDFLPTQLGSLVGYYGPVGLLLLAALLGLLVGGFERYLRAKLTPSRVILLLALLTCLLAYEAGMEVWPLRFRGAIVLVAVVWAIDNARRSLAAGRAKRKRPVPVEVPARLQMGLAPRPATDLGPEWMRALGLR